MINSKAAGLLAFTGAAALDGDVLSVVKTFHDQRDSIVGLATFGQ